MKSQSLKIIFLTCLTLSTIQTQGIAQAGDSLQQTSSTTSSHQPATPILPASVAVTSDYTLKPNDVVTIKVFQEDDLTCIERIAGDGTISMPLAGRIKISGLTPVLAASVITNALKQGYLVNPQTSVSISEATKEYITILGQVASPGSLEIPSNKKINILHAIGMAGGFTRLANPSKITIKRLVNGEESIIKIDAKKLSRDDDATNLSIQSGDVITVSERLF